MQSVHNSPYFNKYAIAEQHQKKKKKKNVQGQIRHKLITCVKYVCKYAMYSSQHTIACVPHTWPHSDITTCCRYYTRYFCCNSHTIFYCYADLHVCCTAHTSILHAAIMNNLLLLLYMDAPFLQPCSFWKWISILFVYIDAHVQLLLEDHDNLQNFDKMMQSNHLLAHASVLEVGHTCLST